MMPFLFTGLALFFLAGLLYSEIKAQRCGILATKPAASLLFVLTAVYVRPGPGGYGAVMLAGLVLCMAGDLFLIFSDRRKMFLAGLVSFLLGHLAYAAAFWSLGRFSWPAATGLIGLALAGFRIHAWLKPGLGRMNRPVIAYIVVISIMVAASLSLALNDGLDREMRLLVPLGAALFYLSDLFVARNQFLKQQTANRLFGLPLYYTAQFLLAFSTAFAG